MMRPLSAGLASLASLALMALVLFTGSPPAHAQGTAAPAVKGMDLVSYHQAGGPVKGQAAFQQDFDGAGYLFASAPNKAAFVADPDRYLPQYGGLCTTGMSKGFKVQADPLAWKIVGGRLHLFRSLKDVPDDAHVAAVVARANENWAKR